MTETIGRLGRWAATAAQGAKVDTLGIVYAKDASDAYLPNDGSLVTLAEKRLEQDGTYLLIGSAILPHETDTGVFAVGVNDVAELGVCYSETKNKRGAWQTCSFVHAKRYSAGTTVRLLARQTSDSSYNDGRYSFIVIKVGM